MHLKIAPGKVSATLAINERSKTLIANGRSVVRLGLGQSPFPVPEQVVDALRSAAHEKDYLPVAGLPELRDAVMAFHVEHGVPAGHVIVAPGSKELLFLTQLVLGRPLLLPRPSWVSYAPQAELAGVTPHWVETDASGFPTQDSLDAACQQIGQPGVLVLNSPNNPTGQCLDDERMRALATVCERHDTIVLSDEIYSELKHDGAHRSFAAHYAPTIVTGGLSKWCGAGGWRLGTAVYPDVLKDLFDAVCAAASETYSAVAAPIQHAAVVAYRGGPWRDAYLERSREVVKTISALATDALRTGGAKVVSPTGAFYLVADLSHLGQADDVALCERLLEERGVAVLPGSAFGLPRESACARLALVDFDGAAALNDAPLEPLFDDVVNACRSIARG